MPGHIHTVPDLVLPGTISQLSYPFLFLVFFFPAHRVYKRMSFPAFKIILSTQCGAAYVFFFLT